VHECQQFNPRTLRKDARRNAYLAVHLSADAKFENAEKVVTTNISEHGCFVYSIREWSTGDRVWLRFLGDDEDICGTVCSWRQWGNNKAMPGIGIKLDVALNNEDPATAP
jgi:PilZ domain